MIREYFQLKRKKEKFENLMLSMGMAKFYLIEDKKIPNGHILKKEMEKENKENAK